MTVSPPDPALLDRLQGRLDRLGLTPTEAARKAKLTPDAVQRLLDGQGALPRGRSLRALADTLECTISYLVGLEPDEPPPEELLQEDQGALGPLLSGDQEALLRAYNRLDVPAKAALLLVAQKMAGPEPEEPADAKKPRRRAKGG